MAFTYPRETPEQIEKRRREEKKKLVSECLDEIGLDDATEVIIHWIEQRKQNRRRVELLNLKRREMGVMTPVKNPANIALIKVKERLNEQRIKTTLKQFKKGEKQ